MKDILKRISLKVKFLFVFILGGIILGGLGVYAAVTISSSSVSYDNSSSGATATDVKGAIDELYNLAKSKSCPSGYTKSGTDDIYTCTNVLFKYGVYSYANQLYLNQAVPANAILHSTPSEALADWTNESVMHKTSQAPFYLKHKIENDVVTESYVVFIVTDEMVQANPGMTAGTYELRGGIDESSASEKTHFIQNAKTIYDAFGTNCSSNPYTTTPSSAFSCSVSGLYADASDSGAVDANDGPPIGCYVTPVASSRCE